MDTETLRLFSGVARRGSFAAAARDYGMEASSVSRAIAGLEQGLGFRLFQRSTRRMTLTEAGGRYLERIEALLADLDSARDDALAVSTAPAGTLRLTSSVAFGTTQILPLLPEFRALYPRLDLDLVFTDANLDLIAERIDLAIRLAQALRADVIATKLMDARYRVCATPAYLARAAPLACPADLAAHDCVLFDLPAFRGQWQFRDAEGRIESVPVRGSIVASSAFAVYTAAKQGLGPVLLPHWLVDGDIAAGVLVDPFPTHHAAAADFSTAAWLLYPSRSHLPSKVRVAIDFLKARLPKRVVG